MGVKRTEQVAEGGIVMELMPVPLILHTKSCIDGASLPQEGEPIPAAGTRQHGRGELLFSLGGPAVDPEGRLRSGSPSAREAVLPASVVLPVMWSMRAAVS